MNVHPRIFRGLVFRILDRRPRSIARRVFALCGTTLPPMGRAVLILGSRQILAVRQCSVRRRTIRRLISGDDVELLEVETGNSSAMLGMLAAETHPLMFLRE